MQLDSGFTPQEWWRIENNTIQKLFPTLIFEATDTMDPEAIQQEFKKLQDIVNNLREKGIFTQYFGEDFEKTPIEHETINQMSDLDDYQKKVIMRITRDRVLTACEDYVFTTKPKNMQEDQNNIAHSLAGTLLGLDRQQQNQY